MPILQPSPEVLLCSFLTCKKICNTSERAVIQFCAYVFRCGLETHPFLGSYLVSILAEFGCIDNAQRVFDNLTYHDKHSTSSLISAYSKLGELRQALFLLRDVNLETETYPHRYALLSFIKACSSMKDMEIGSELHTLLLNRQRWVLVENDVFIGSALVSMHAKCGSLEKAQEIFDQFMDPDVVLWTALVRGYVEHGCDEEALDHVKNMECNGVSPDAFTIVCSLKACSSLRCKERGQEVHAEAMKRGFETELVVGNSLIDMYAQCRLLATSQDLLNKFRARDVVSWNGLISGYVEYSDDENAIWCFNQMQCEGIPWDAVTLVSILKCCGCNMGDTHKVQEIHMWICKLGFDKDTIVGNSLIHGYAKCGLLEESRQILINLTVHDVISWTALLNAYVEQGCSEEALNYFQEMQHNCIAINFVTFVCCMKACGNLASITMGYEIHTQVLEKGWETELLVGNALVDMYAKCGELATAQYVFDSLRDRDVISWNAIISGYVEIAKGKEALCIMEQMDANGVIPNPQTIVYIFHACGTIGNFSKVQELHSFLVKKGLEEEIFVINAVMSTYVKCSLLLEAQDLFDKLPSPDVVSYCTLLTGYAEYSHDEKAHHCLKQVQDSAISMNVVIYACGLKICGNTRMLIDGHNLHTQLVIKGLEFDPIIGSTLVDMYAKCGLIEESQEVFDKLLVRDVVSWTTLMVGYISCGCVDEALSCFNDMQEDMVYVNVVAYICTLKACASIRNMSKGLEIQCEIAKKGFEKDSLVVTTMVDMYAKCGFLEEAQIMFEKLPVRDVVSATILLSGYIEHGFNAEALVIFEEIQRVGIVSNAITYVCGLKACGSSNAICKGMEIHVEITKKGLDNDVLVGNSLIDLYVRNSLLETAQHVLDNLPSRDVVSWNTIIAGYAEYGHGEKVLMCIDHMYDEGINVSDVSFIFTLKAYVSIGAIVRGQEIHSMIIKKGLETENVLGNILIDMYAKCGLLTEAQSVFDKHPIHDHISWNALMTGYALQGESNDVFHILDRMMRANISPSLLTFINVLNACSHDGLLDEAQTCFEIIVEYGSLPMLEHYTCMVDLYGRGGHVDNVVEIIRRMPLHPDIVMWHIMLTMCRKCGHLELALLAFEHAVGLDPKAVATYVSMSNIYADADVRLLTSEYNIRLSEQLVTYS